MSDEFLYRVKVFKLLGEQKQWIDKGMGYVKFCNQITVDGSDIYKFMVLSDKSNDLLILDQPIIRNILFAKQDQTLISWTHEKEDISLSFQSENIRNDIFNQIVEYQKLLDQTELDAIQNKLNQNENNKSLLPNTLESFSPNKNYFEGFELGTTEDIKVSPKSDFVMEEIKASDSQQSILPNPNIDKYEFNDHDDNSDQIESSSYTRKISSVSKYPSLRRMRLAAAPGNSTNLSSNTDQISAQKSVIIPNPESNDENVSRFSERIITTSKINTLTIAISHPHHAQSDINCSLPEKILEIEKDNKDERLNLDSALTENSEDLAGEESDEGEEIEDVDEDEEDEEEEEDALEDTNEESSADNANNTADTLLLSSSSALHCSDDKHDYLYDNNDDEDDDEITLSLGCSDKTTPSLYNTPHINTNNTSSSLSLHSTLTHKISTTSTTQQNSSSSILLNSTNSHAASVKSLLLPECTIANLGAIETVIADHVGFSGTPGFHAIQAGKRENLASALESTGYVTSLLETFRMCEDIEDLNALHTLFRIVKGLFLLNRNSVLELLLADDAILDVLGCLEYDPNYHYSTPNIPNVINVNGFADGPTNNIHKDSDGNISLMKEKNSSTSSKQTNNTLASKKESISDNTKGKSMGETVSSKESIKPELNSINTTIGCVIETTETQFMECDSSDTIIIDSSTPSNSNNEMNVIGKTRIEFTEKSESENCNITLINVTKNITSSSNQLEHLEVLGSTEASCEIDGSINNTDDNIKKTHTCAKDVSKSENNSDNLLTNTQQSPTENDKLTVVVNPQLPKFHHRAYICQDVRYMEAIPISNPELLKRIHQTYRAQYIMDVVLPLSNNSANAAQTAAVNSNGNNVAKSNNSTNSSPFSSFFLDDNSNTANNNSTMGFGGFGFGANTPNTNILSALSSFIYFNKMEIVNFIQEDNNIIQDVFERLTSETCTAEQKKNLILFFKELCVFSQSLQNQNKDFFFKVLMQKGILSVMETLLPCDDDTSRNAIIDILWFLVEYNPGQIREFILKECQTDQDEDSYFLNVLVEQMICDPDPELGNALQISIMLKTIADPENMASSLNKSEKTEFLSFFYKYNMHVLIAPLLANTTEDKLGKDDYRTALLLSIILEVVTFYVSHHTIHSKNYFISKDILRRTLILLRSKHHFLVLCALRLLRTIVGLKDEFYNRYIIRSNLFSPVFETFKRNGSRYNLLHSAILELFDFLNSEDIKSLLNYTVDSFFETYNLGKLTYTDVFTRLKKRYDLYKLGTTLPSFHGHQQQTNTNGNANLYSLHYNMNQNANNNQSMGPLSNTLNSGNNNSATSSFLSSNHDDFGNVLMNMDDELSSENNGENFETASSTDHIFSTSPSINSTAKDGDFFSSASPTTLFKDRDPVLHQTSSMLNSASTSFQLSDLYGNNTFNQESSSGHTPVVLDESEIERRREEDWFDAEDYNEYVSTTSTSNSNSADVSNNNVTTEQPSFFNNASVEIKNSTKLVVNPDKEPGNANLDKENKDNKSFANINIETSSSLLYTSTSQKSTGQWLKNSFSDVTTNDEKFGGLFNDETIVESSQTTLITSTTTTNKTSLSLSTPNINSKNNILSTHQTITTVIRDDKIVGSALLQRSHSFASIKPGGLLGPPEDLSLLTDKKEFIEPPTSKRKSMEEGGMFETNITQQQRTISNFSVKKLHISLPNLLTNTTPTTSNNESTTKPMASTTHNNTSMNVKSFSNIPNIQYKVSPLPSLVDYSLDDDDDEEDEKDK